MKTLEEIEKSTEIHILFDRQHKLINEKPGIPLTKKEKREFTENRNRIEQLKAEFRNKKYGVI